MIKAGVLGSPISHSLSPLLHRIAYQSLGVAAEYNAFEVASGSLEEFLLNEGKSLNCLSLTMPLKEEALTIADHVSNISQQIASGNTLHKKEDGWHLTSTDVEGFSYALKAAGNFPTQTVLIIGGGATARAVAAACNHPSASITVIGRSSSRHESIRHAAPNASVTFVDWDRQLALDDFDLVINTTPANTAAVFLERVNSPKGVFFEVIYNPWPTSLLSKWREVGGIYVDGLDLLVHQAISQVEIFADQKVNRLTMAQLLRFEGLDSLQ